MCARAHNMKRVCCILHITYWYAPHDDRCVHFLEMRFETPPWIGTIKYNFIIIYFFVEIQTDECNIKSYCQNVLTGAIGDRVFGLSLRLVLYLLGFR